MAQEFGTWEEYVNAVQEHFERIKEKFKDDPEMKKLLMVFEKVFLGNFEFKWKHGERLVVIEDVIPIAVNEEVVPQAEALRDYLITEYPAVLYVLFVERINRYFNEANRCIQTKDFEVLRQTINNLELLSTNQMSHSIELEGRGGKIILRLPLEVEIEDAKTPPMDLWGTSMFIAENFDKIFEKIKEMTRASE